MLDRKAALVRVVGLITAGTALGLALLPFATRLPNFVVPDDGFFYARIAFELARHHRSTFDGIHTTSGYHLPWAFALAGVSKLVGLFTYDPKAHLGAHLVLSCIVGIATVARFFRGPASRVCALVVFVSTFSLTEMAIALPLMLGILASAFDERGKHRAEAWLAFALPLVRVDMVCVPVAVALGLARGEPRRALRLAGAAAVGAALQLGMMQAIFGEPFGVAAWIKVTTRIPVPLEIVRNVCFGSFHAFSYVAEVGLVGLALWLRNDRVTRAATLGAVSFLVMHTCLSVVRPWYWAPGWIGLAFVLERAAASSKRAPGRLPTLAALGITLVFLVHGARVEIVYAEDQRGAATFLGELKARVPESAPLFTYDNPGFLGFFSGRGVVDGDGLVNDHAYARRYVSGRLAGYLDEERLCYLVVDYMDDDPILDLSGLVVRRDDTIPLFAIRRHEDNQADFALHRLRAPRCAE